MTYQGGDTIATVAAGVGGLADLGERLRGGLAAAAGDDAHAAARGLDRGAEDRRALVGGQRPALAGAAVDDDPVHAVADDRVGQPGKALDVERQVLPKRRGQRRVDAAKRADPSSLPPSVPVIYLQNQSLHAKHGLRKGPPLRPRFSFIRTCASLPRAFHCDSCRWRSSTVSVSRRISRSSLW